LVVGVGGQGTVLAGDILSEVGMLAGYDAKKSDVLGLAIRGGSVVSHVRWGDKVDAPLSMRGKVDFLLAFEPLEGLRQLEFLHEKSVVVYNEYKIPPVAVSSGLATYPADDKTLEAYESCSGTVYRFNATNKAVELGGVKSVNVILLGAFSALIDVEPGVWEEAIKKYVPAKYQELNIKAFNTGRELIQAKQGVK
ncbi:MAG: indolepyruvate oxidoreductase subunit beta, partial [Spirochaetia bacterium]